MTNTTIRLLLETKAYAGSSCQALNSGPIPSIGN